MRRTILPFLLTVLASPLAAQNAACTARVDGQDVVIAPGAMVDGSGAGLRERLTSWPSRGWDRVWGNPRSCDSGVLIAFLAGIEGMTEDEADDLCLAELPEDQGYLLVPGERNFRGLCRVTICDRVVMASNDTEAVTGRIDALASAVLPDGIEGTVRGSGAVLLSGNAGIASQLLGPAVSPEIAGLLTSPQTAVTVMAVGGLVYYCGG